LGGYTRYVKAENNQYILGYLLQLLDGGAGSNCRSIPPYVGFCVPNDIMTINDLITLTLNINIPYNAPLPSAVGFYMKVEDTGQVILIDIVTPQTGYLQRGRWYNYQEGYQINSDTTISKNPLVTLVSAGTTFKLKAVMNDINGNLAYVHVPVSIYATITTPSGTIITEPIVINHLNFPTRIVNLRVYPNPAGSGQKTTVSGQLQRLTQNGQWVGLSGKEVDIDRLVYDIDEWVLSTEAFAVTDVNGNFSATITAPSAPGTHTLYVRYPGNDNELLTGTYATISFTVVGSVKPTPTPTTTKPKLSAGDLAILLGGAGLLTGITAYGLSKKGKA